MKPPRQIKLKAFTYLFDALQFIKFTFSSSGGKEKKKHWKKELQMNCQFCMKIYSLFLWFVSTHTFSESHSLLTTLSSPVTQGQSSQASSKLTSELQNLASPDLFSLEGY